MTGGRRFWGKGLPGVAAAAVLAAGCAGTPARDGDATHSAAGSPAALPATPVQPPKEDAFANRIIQEARGFLGTPYRAGGEDAIGMDCSGLVKRVFAGAGVATPRTALAQQEAAMRVELEDLRPGDLVFFRLPDPHVGIYLGGGEFIHAPGSGRAVTMARLDEPYFLLGFAGGGRFQPSPTVR